MQLKPRIGLFPGTFNPLHEGHVRFALAALKQAHLNKIIFLPERSPRNKPDAADIDARVAFAQTVISKYSQLEIRTLLAPTQTYQAEQQELADIFEVNRVVLLVGTDILRTMGDWQDIELLLRDHELCIGLRGNETTDSVIEHVKLLESKVKVKVDFTIVETDHKHVSSTSIRASQDYISL
jgi:nicotinate-nucleotide adenylyltransferase